VIYTLPFIAALVGWFTNYLAVKMLFYPKKPVNLGFMKLQGIFPKNQHQVAEKIGKMVAEELLSSKDLRDKLNNPENMDTVQGLVEARIDYYLNTTFPKTYPLASAILGSKRKAKFKNQLMTEVQESVPRVVDQYMDHMEERFDIESIIEQRVAALPSEKLEGLIMKLLNKEFKFIEYMGAIIGFIIGWIQVGLVSL
jgi:uncharacterized membrane protein YheB (UPF0754 family)